MQRREEYPGEASDRSKNPKPISRNKSTPTKNKENQQTEQLAISRQPTYRTDQERERKENKKNTEIGRNTQKNMLCM